MTHPLITAALEQRAHMTLWFVGELGGAVSIACASENSRHGYLTTLRAKRRVILSENGRDGLRSLYLDWIGYDPFADDPQITDAEVAKTLAEYLEEAKREGAL